MYHFWWHNVLCLDRLFQRRDGHRIWPWEFSTIILIHPGPTAQIHIPNKLLACHPESPSKSALSSSSQKLLHVYIGLYGLSSGSFVKSTTAGAFHYTQEEESRVLEAFLWLPALTSSMASKTETAFPNCSTTSLHWRITGMMYPWWPQCMKQTWD